MRLFLLFTFFLGCFMILANQLITPPPTKIQVKYISRDLDVLLRELPSVSNQFGAMFVSDDIPTV